MILTILSIIWFSVTIIAFKRAYKISDDFDAKLGLSIPKNVHRHHQSDGTNQHRLHETSKRSK